MGVRAIMNETPVACPICAAPTVPAGEKKGKFIETEFRFRHCPACHYSFVENPVENYAAIYDEKYYRGMGPDPMLDYINELDSPASSVRTYEWRGILEAVNTLHALRAETQVLDFGCG